MRLWHDDVRPAPEGWVWARTNAEAQVHLRTGKVVEVSLDHDLGAHEVDTANMKAGSEEWFRAMHIAGMSAETGYDLVNWMLDNNCVPEKVTIHSWNPAGARNMAARLNRFGHDVVVAPFRL